MDFTHWNEIMKRLLVPKLPMSLKILLKGRSVGHINFVANHNLKFNTY